MCKIFLKTKSFRLCPPFRWTFFISCTGQVGFDVLAIEIYEPSRYWSFFLFSRKTLIYSLSNSKCSLLSLDKSFQHRKPLKPNTTRHVVCKLLRSPLPNLEASIICLMIRCSVGEANDIFWWAYAIPYTAL